MKEYFIDVLRYHYADFSGKATRKQYWLFVLWVVIFGIGIALFSAPFIMLYPMFSIIWATIMLAYNIPHWAITVRRIRDTGFNPYWGLLLIPSIVSCIFSLLVVMRLLSLNVPQVKTVKLFIDAAQVLSGMPLLIFCLLPSKK